MKLTYLVGAAAAAIQLTSGVAQAQTVVDSVFTGEQSAFYSDANNWSPREVPNNSATRIYNVTVPGRVRVDMHVRVSNLSANGLLIGSDASVVVTGSATIGSLPPSETGDTSSGLMLIQGAVFAVEGTLTNFDSTTRTLKGGDFYLSGWSQRGSTVSTLRFPGADIVNLESSLQLLGSLVQILDERDADALRNFARIGSGGAFSISGLDFTTAGDFTNLGTLNISNSTLRVSGSYTTFDPATRTLSGGALEIGDAGRLQFSGADVLRNKVALTVPGSGAIVDQNGNNALRNLAFNDAGARFVPPSGFTTAGPFTNAGEMIIVSASGPGGGKFNMAPGQRYVQTAGRTLIGSGAFTGDMEIAGGELTGSSSFFAGVAVVNGNVVLGAALFTPREVQVNGSVTFGANTRMRIAGSFGGLTQLHALLVVDGSVAVDGTIEIVDASEFPEAGNFFFPAIFSRNLSGAFGNAPNGARVSTTSGRGSYLIVYQNDSVLIGGYQRIPAAAQLLNISTRAKVGTGDNVTIGGFIISGFIGNEPRRIAVRGIGPSLHKAGVSSVLADPVVELHDSRGNLLATSDNWQDAQADEIRASGLAPDDDRESALIATLPRGAYTVVLRGSNQTEGTGLIEVYDLVHDSRSKLANISTRGFVDAGNPLIGGYISGGEGPGDSELTVRAVGPGLKHASVSNFLPDPTLEMRDANGALVVQNDDHRLPAENARTIIPGLTPYEEKDAATGLMLPRGDYTVIVRGKEGASGVALVEIYDHNR